MLSSDLALRGLRVLSLKSALTIMKACSKCEVHSTISAFLIKPWVQMAPLIHSNSLQRSFPSLPKVIWGYITLAAPFLITSSLFLPLMGPPPQKKILNTITLKQLNIQLFVFLVDVLKLRPVLGIQSFIEINRYHLSFLGVQAANQLLFLWGWSLWLLLFAVAFLFFSKTIWARKAKKKVSRIFKNNFCFLFLKKEPLFSSSGPALVVGGLRCWPGGGGPVVFQMLFQWRHRNDAAVSSLWFHHSWVSAEVSPKGWPTQRVAQLEKDGEEIERLE